MDFTIEELSMNAWPSIQTLVYDGWIIRMANGYTKRANSIHPIYPSKINLEKKIRHCEGLYTAHKLPAIYKLVECEEHGIIDKELETLGYEPLDLTSVQVCGKIEVRETNYKGIKISAGFDNEWIRGFIECKHITAGYLETIKVMLGNITGNKIVVRKEQDNDILGCGYGVLENGYAGLFDIVVKENERGKGYGNEIVRTILSEAGRAGIKKSYLQVAYNNEAARGLYKKIGYEEHYKYWYRRK
jgi:ribosomal protein S18 acetylase RimI-like enzyme